MKSPWFITIALALISCSKNEQQETYMEIAGVILPKPDGPIYLVEQSNCVGFNDFTNPIDSFSQDSTGKFHFRIASSDLKDSMLTIVNGDGYKMLSYPLIVFAGDSVYCQLDYSDRNDRKIKFSGKSKYIKEHNVLQEYFSETQKANWGRVDYSVLEDSFLIEMEKRKTLNQSVLNNYFDSIAHSGIIKEIILEDKMMELSWQYYRYLGYHNYYANDSFFYKKDYSPAFASFLERFIDFEPIIPNSANHIQLVENRLNHLLNTDDTYADLAYDERPNALWMLIKNDGAGINQAAGLFYFLNSFSHTMAIPNAFNLLDSCQDLANNHLKDGGKAIFHKKYERLAALKPGTVAPDFSLPNQHDSLIVLSSFKGKVIYIDFWGTWCMPCLKEIPNNHALMDSFDHREDFVFSISRP